MTAVVAWLALGVSSMSLAWQILSWRRSGAHLKLWCEVHYFGEEAYLQIQVVNAGRYATTVNEVGFRVMAGQRARSADLKSLVGPGNKVLYWTSSEVDFPQRLEGQAELNTGISLGDDPDLIDLLNSHPMWNLYPYVQAGGRILFGEPIKDIRNRLKRS